MDRIIVDVQGARYEIDTIQKCARCGNEFDLLKYGFPGNPFRKVCWTCEYPVYAIAREKGYKISDEELDYLESRCLREEEV